MLCLHHCEFCSSVQTPSHQSRMFKKRTYLCQCREISVLASSKFYHKFSVHFLDKDWEILKIFILAFAYCVLKWTCLMYSNCAFIRVVGCESCNLISRQLHISFDDTVALNSSYFVNNHCSVFPVSFLLPTIFQCVIFPSLSNYMCASRHLFQILLMPVSILV